MLRVPSAMVGLPRHGLCEVSESEQVRNTHVGGEGRSWGEGGDGDVGRRGDLVRLGASVG